MNEGENIFFYKFSLTKPITNLFQTYNSKSQTRKNQSVDSMEKPIKLFCLIMSLQIIS